MVDGVVNRHLVGSAAEHLKVNAAHLYVVSGWGAENLHIDASFFFLGGGKTARPLQPGVSSQRTGLLHSGASWCVASFAVTSFCGFVAAATVAAAGSMGDSENYAPIYAVSMRTSLRTGAVRTAWFAVYQRVYQCLFTSG